MGVMQRIIMLLLLVMLFVFGVSKVNFQQEEKWVAQWEASQTEMFLKKLCEEKQLFYEDIMLYAETLNYMGNSSEIRMEEYQRETDMEGTVYYYIVSWEEILAFLMEGESYQLSEDGVFAVTVIRHNKTKSVENRYFESTVGWE